MNPKVSYDNVELVGLYSEEPLHSTIFGPLPALAGDGFLFALDRSNRESGGLALNISIPALGTEVNGGFFVSEALVANYFDALAAELQTYSTYLDRDRPLAAIIFSGDGANAYSSQHLESLLEHIAAEFSVSQSIEVSIGCNPAYLTARQIDDLRRIGFNRIRIKGVDFSFEVRDALSCGHAELSIAEQMAYIRKRGRIAVELALQYGWPFQTAESFQQSAARAASLTPDLVVLHLADATRQSRSVQERLNAFGLPQMEESLSMFLDAVQALDAAGYEATSSSTFVRKESGPGHHAGLLGYSHKVPVSHYIGVGASARSMVGGVLAQNEHDFLGYIRDVTALGYSPKVGDMLGVEQRLRLAVYRDIMGTGTCRLDRIGELFSISFDEVAQICGLSSDYFKILKDRGIVALKGKELSLCHQLFTNSILTLFGYLV